MNIRIQKKLHSEQRVAELNKHLESADEIAKLKDLTIFVSGSYARKEASTHSDIDLFFVQNGEMEDIDSPNISSLRMFSQVIEISDKLGFPKFSNDGEFLKIIESGEILHHLGGREDDFKNHFTARLLMILESKCVFNQNSYDSILKSVLGAYFIDYPDHPKDFQPTFLVNDIIRFWKTLCLNYENKRNQPDENQEKRIKQKIKNLKLKFSRMLTCYGSIAHIVASETPVDLEDILEMLELTPLERLENVCERTPKLQPVYQNALTEYEWFLSTTDVPECELISMFSDKNFRKNAFERANRFGGNIFEITHELSSKAGYLRFLLV